MTHLVMVIDDSLTVRKIVEVTCRRQGLDCVSYADGVEALRALHDHIHAIPDLLLLDVGLPQMDGYRLLRHFRFRSAFAHMNIIILSARGGVLDHLCTRIAGASGYIHKPFRTDELVALFATYLHITPVAVYEQQSSPIIPRFQ